MANAHERGWLHGVGVFIASFTAFALPISTAATSVGNALVLIGSLAILLGQTQPDSGQRLRLSSTIFVLALIGWVALSLLWTDAAQHDALKDLVKYGKLLVIPGMIVLLPRKRDALLALGCYAFAQAFVVLSSWLLYLGIDLPWVPNGNRMTVAVVYTDYISQSIMTATFAALCWVLKGAAPGRFGPAVAVAIAVAALLDTLFLLPGRSGWVVAAVLLTMIVWWHLPRRLKAAALLAPVLLAGLLLVSDMGRERLSKVIDETDRYVEQGAEQTSSGERLNFWHRSLTSIAKRPLIGSGVGSWQLRYYELEGGDPPEGTRNTRNPHNEYLLLGVQTGLVGVLLFVALLVAVWRDGRRFDTATARAVMLLTASLAVGSLFNSALFDGAKGRFFCIVAGLLFAWGVSARKPLHVSPQSPSSALNPRAGAQPRLQRLGDLGSTATQVAPAADA
ncbi:MAG: O-antigen ligase family protein [Burkholderiales bacterium]